MEKLYRLDLQLMAEGAGAGASGAAGVSAATGADQGAGEEAESGETQAKSDAAGLAGVKSQRAKEFYQKHVMAKRETSQQETSEEAKEPEGEVQTEKPAEKTPFEELLKDPDYKAEFDKRQQDTINRRFKTAKAAEETLQKLTPLLEVLGKKYDQDTSDVSKLDLDKLVNAVLDDDTLYEAEALEMGVSVDSLKQIKQTQRENAQLQREIEERERQEKNRQAYERLVQQSQQVKQIYPSFELAREMGNPNFSKLIASGVDPRTAYEVVHKDEIIPAAMHFTAQKTQEKIASAIASGTKRPVENGSSSQSAAVTKINVEALTPQQRREYIRRAQRGEKVTF